jgi:hypothetical protein
VIVVAPHSTILDSLTIVLANAIPISKGEIKGYPVIGRIARFQQVIIKIILTSGYSYDGNMGESTGVKLTMERNYARF